MIEPGRPACLCRKIEARKSASEGKFSRLNLMSKA
jgi:hypothetical protein